MSIDFRFGGQHIPESEDAPQKKAPAKTVSLVNDYDRTSPMIGDILLAWRTLEHEHFDITPRAYMIVGGALLCIIAYAIFTDSPLMAIVFILIGAVGYLSTQKEPRELEYLVTSKGVAAGRDFYSYREMASFWIFEDTDFLPFVSFSLPEKFAQHIHIPIGDVEPETLREALLEFLPEEEHELDLIDTLGKMFHI